MGLSIRGKSRKPGELHGSPTQPKGFTQRNQFFSDSTGSNSITFAGNTLVSMLPLWRCGAAPSRRN